MNPMLKKSEKGLTLVEVLISTSIILVTIVTLLGVHTLYLKIALANSDSVKGAYLAEEGIEAMRFLRDSSWSLNIAPLSLGVDYGMVMAGGTWQASTTNLYVEKFQRTVRLSSVSRDASADIVASGGTLDTDIKLVVSTVSWWNGFATTTKSISTYLTNINQN